jgi:hypothetical protein
MGEGETAARGNQEEGRYGHETNATNEHENPNHPLPKRGPISGSELQGETCSGNGRYGSEVGYYWGCDNPLSVGKGE